MHRLVHAEVALPEAGGGQHPDGAGDLAGFVGEDVPEDVVRDDDIELPRVAHELHGRVVHVQVGERHLRVVGGDLGDDAPPQAGTFEDIGLVHAGDPAAALLRHIEGDAGDAADLPFRVAFHIVGGRPVGCVRLRAVRSEVDAAGQLPHDEDIQALPYDLGLQRGGIGQLRKDHGRPQVGEEAQLLAQPQERTLRTLVAGHIVPFGAAHRREQHGIAGPARIQRLSGQTGAHGVDGRAARQDLHIVEVMAEFGGDGVQDLQGLAGDLRADAVPGNDSDLIVHREPTPLDFSSSDSYTCK